MRPEFKYGLITGAGVCLWMILEYRLGFHTTRVAIGEYSGYFSSLVPLVTLFLLLKQKQVETPGGRLGLGQGISAGFFASFIASVIVYCFLVGYSQFINPGWLDYTLDWKVARWRGQGVAEIDIRRAITLYRQANSPGGLIATTVAGMTLLGGVFSLGLTFLVRRLSRESAG
jgi:hypothetical protein